MQATSLGCNKALSRRPHTGTPFQVVRCGLPARPVPGGCTMLRRSLLLSSFVIGVPLYHLLGSRAAVAMATGRASGATARRRPPASQQQLVDHLIDEGLVRSQQVADALLAVDRGRYVNPDYVDVELEAYQDRPLLNGAGQTISAPHMHAICLSLLEDHLGPGTTALDVGSGSGYLTAAMAKVGGGGGRVLGVEQVPSLVQVAQDHVAAANPELVEGPQPPVEMRVLNVLADDAAEQLSGWAPFDAIHVGAAAAQVPHTLLELLKPGGRMVIPVGDQDQPQTLMKVDKHRNGQFSAERLLSVGYVPLTPPTEVDAEGYMWVPPA